MGCLRGFDLPYYTKDKVLTKSHIFSHFENNQELLQYIPWGAKASSLTKELLLSILVYIKKDKYLILYGIYKATKLQRSKTGKKNYDIRIQANFVNKIKEYVTISK